MVLDGIHVSGFVFSFDYGSWYAVLYWCFNINIVRTGTYIHVSILISFLNNRTWPKSFPYLSVAAPSAVTNPLADTDMIYVVKHQKNADIMWQSFSTHLYVFLISQNFILFYFIVTKSQIQLRSVLKIQTTMKRWEPRVQPPCHTKEMTM